MDDGTYELENPVSGPLQETVEMYDLGVSTWMDTGGRANPVLWVDDTAIVMVNYGSSYDVVNVTTLDDMEESMFAESDVLDDYSDDGVLDYEPLEQVFRDMADYTNIASYLDAQEVTVDAVNDGQDGMLDTVRRYLGRDAN